MPLGSQYPQPLGRRALLAGGLSLAACAGPNHAERVAPVEPHPPSARAALEARSFGQLALYQVGHSTHVLGLGSRLLITDPWFSDPADYVYRHQFGVGLEPHQVGALDVIAITHDHGDHFDLPALDQMDKSAVVVVASDSMKSAVKRLGFREVEVPRPWERIEARGLSITATPALHYGYEINYVFSEVGSSARVFFGGDTAWHDGIQRVADELRPTLALLPVDGTHFGPRGRAVVMNPEEAVRAARVLKAKAVIPTHCQDVVPSSLGRWLFPRPAGSVGRFLAGCRRELPDCDARFLAPGERFLVT